MATMVRKWGNSLGIRVPKAIAEQVHLTNGTEVELDTSEGVLTIRPKSKRRRSKYKLADLLAKMKGPSPHGEWANDPPVGREII
jgi:antitoxin MazE